MDIIHFILNFNEFSLAQQELADFNQDGPINITDIVNMVQLILGDDLSKGDDPTYKLAMLTPRNILTHYTLILKFSNNFNELIDQFI